MSKSKAALLLITAAKSGASAWQNTLSAMREAVKEKVQGDAKKKEARDALIKWAVGILKEYPGTYGTISGYCRKAASIALVPNAVGTVTTGKGDKMVTHEVKADAIKTRRDLSAVAEAANKTLGIVKKANSGRSPAPAEPTEADRTLARKQMEAAKKGDAMAVKSVVDTALDGKHGDMRDALVSALAGHGFKLAPMEAASAAQAADRLNGQHTKASKTKNAKADKKQPAPAAH